LIGIIGATFGATIGAVLLLVSYTGKWVMTA
jgi:hypothetical protein